MGGVGQAACELQVILHALCLQPLQHPVLPGTSKRRILLALSHGPCCGFVPSPRFARAGTALCSCLDAVCCARCPQALAVEALHGLASEGSEQGTRMPALRQALKRLEVLVLMAGQAEVRPLRTDAMCSLVRV